MGISNGYFSDNGTIWYSCCGSDGVRFLYLEAEQVHSEHVDAGTRPRFQEIGRYHYKAYRPTEIDTDGTKSIKQEL